MDETTLNEVLRKLNILLDEKNGLKLSGQGMVANNTAEILTAINKMNSNLIHLENKVEALMDEKALERLEKIKNKNYR